MVAKSGGRKNPPNRTAFISVGDREADVYDLFV